MRSYLQKQALKKEDQLQIRQKEMKNLSEMKQIFAVVSITSMEEYDKWKRLLGNFENKNLKITWVCYVVNIAKDQLEELPENVYTKYDMNFFGFPKANLDLKKKYHAKYDLTLDLNFDHVYLLNLIWVTLNSGLRVGATEKKEMKEYYDFFFSTSNPKEQPKLFIDQVFYFLENINK